MEDDMSMSSLLNEFESDDEFENNMWEGIMNGNLDKVFKEDFFEDMEFDFNFGLSDDSDNSNDSDDTKWVYFLIV